MVFQKPFLVVIIVSVVTIITSSVQAEGGKYYAIPAATLSETLKRITEEANVSIVFDDRLVANHQAPALSGLYTEEKALSTVLEGTGLKCAEVSDGVWAVTIDDANASHIEVVNAPAVEEVAGNTDAIFVTASFLTPFREVGGKVLYTIGEEEILLSGSTNIAEPIFDLPLTVASVSSANTALLYSSGGLNLVDMHGLGTDRTLLLVNGRRYVRTSGGVGKIFGVDLNAIPTSFVERVEVVNRAAGATLGSEAVAGAVNIVLREDVDGLILSLDGGAAAAGDAGEYSVSALAGSSFFDGRGQITLGGMYASDASLLAQERDYLTRPSGFGLNGRISNEPGAQFERGFGGTPVSEKSAVAGVVNADDDVVFLPLYSYQVVANDGGGFEQYEGRLDQLYDWTRDFSILPEIERFSGYAAADFEFLYGHNAYLDFHFSHSKVRSQVAAAPVSVMRGGDPRFGGAFAIAADHPDAPAGLLEAVEALTGEAVSEYLISRRFVELGPRLRNIDRRNIQMTTGITGALGQDWQYDISYQFGQSRADDALSNSIDRDRLSTAIDIDSCEMTAGCAPINIFAPSTITPAQADFIRAAPAERRLTVRETAIRLDLSSPFYVMDGLESNINLGVERRQVRLTDKVAPSLTDGSLLGESLFPGVQGNAYFTEVFASVQVPLFSEKTWADAFEVGGAYRFISRSEGDSFSNISVNTIWAPIDGLEFHGHVFYGGRAPNVTELFGAGPDTYRAFNDPCSEGGQGDAVAICAADGPLGVGSGFVQENTVLLGRFNGNPELQHERIRASTFGFSVELDKHVDVMPGKLALTASWRRRRIDDAIVGVGYRGVLDGCYSAAMSINIVCQQSPVTGASFIRRDPQSRQLNAVEETLLNQGFFRLSGLDARLTYQSEMPDLGWRGLGWLQNVLIDAQYSYAHRFRVREVFDSEDFRLEGLTAFPRHQLNVTASLGNEKLSTYWTMRRRGTVVGSHDFNSPAARAPAVAYFDAAVQWRAKSHFVLYAGVENLLDRNLRPVAGEEPIYFYGHYDAVGRRFFGGLRAEF